jgi:hypothetical protein
LQISFRATIVGSLARSPEGMRAVVVGLGVGLAAALALGRLIASLL